MRSLYRALSHPLASTLRRPQRQKTATPAFPGRGFGLGPLESRLLELLWAQQCALTVRHLHLVFPELAYTTVMTTLDRLYRKGLLLRHKHGRAFAYEPRYPRERLLGELVSGHVTDLLGISVERTVVLSTLVRAVGGMDAALLDELDALVQAERARLKMEDK
jgi:predicted transcriptional regulator